MANAATQHQFPARVWQQAQSTTADMVSLAMAARPLNEPDPWNGYRQAKHLTVAALKVLGAAGK